MQRFMVTPVLLPTPCSLQLIYNPTRTLFFSFFVFLFVRIESMFRFSLRALQSASPASLSSSTATGSVASRSKLKRVISTKAKLDLRRDKRRKLARARATHIYEKTDAMQSALQSTTNARDILIAQLADQIFSRGHEFHSTATNVAFVPDGNPATPEVALVGRGRVGKTALLRSLFREGRTVGRSNTVLRRDGINFFGVGGGVFNIADCPGFGGVSMPWSNLLQSAILTRNFVRYRPNLKMLYYCMDISPRHGVYIQDIDMLRFLSSESPNFTIVLTKGDKIQASEAAHRRFSSKAKDTYLFSVEDVRKELLRNDIQHPVLVTSAYDMGGIDTLRYDMVMNAVHSLPTERLTLAEARRLSERLLTQAEMGTVRQLFIPPTDVDEATQAWNAAVESTELAGHANPLQLETTTTKLPGGNGATEPISNLVPSRVPTTLKDDDPIFDDKALLLTDKSSAQRNIVSSGTAGHPAAYQSLVRTMSNDTLMKYVHETSPWRNPALWPSNIIPTKHPRKNIMRCPEDPANPYLTQAHFVAPRTDMYFRRPNVGCRRAAQRGKYEADDPKIGSSAGRYSIPHFPEIVDAKLMPLPWMFLGSKEAYFEKNGGKQLGIRLAEYALREQIDALSDNPAPHNLALTAELARLEGRQSAPLRSPTNQLSASTAATSCALPPPQSIAETCSSTAAVSNTTRRSPPAAPTGVLRPIRSLRPLC